MPHHKEKTKGAGGAAGHDLLAAREDPIHHYQAVMESYDPDVTYCCKPGGCQYADDILNTNNLSESVRVICNNEHCQEGNYMHAFCFEEWEKSVLSYLRSTGRARSWSEKQRLQNLWTKKGYDLAYKACNCKCGKGHIRKDLDWEPTAKGAVCREEVKKRRNRRRKNEKPSLTLTGSNANKNCSQSQHNGAAAGIAMMRLRSSSMSSTGSGSGSPPSSGEYSSPTNHGTAGEPIAAIVAVAAHGTGCKSKAPFFSDRRERHNSGSIFCRRQDYSSFNTLPRHKINSYHIKMEDEGSHGNDDTRCFLLSTLSTNKINRIPCILCHGNMMIFDRYPLVDGTFFLSPRQHSKGSVPIVIDGGVQYLNVVCMGCLEGWNTSFRCRYCQSRWNGSDLILGSMYSYDIFAATPCCPERLRCNNCHKMVMPPEHRLQFFSDYSHSVACPHCRAIDFHFVKSLSTYHRRERGE